MIKKSKTQNASGAEKVTFPGWFNANKPPELPITVQKAVEKYESQMGQWKYLVEQWNVVEK